jgi:hypothetical protein
MIVECGCREFRDGRNEGQMILFGRCGVGMDISEGLDRCRGTRGGHPPSLYTLHGPTVIQRNPSAGSALASPESDLF